MKKITNLEFINKLLISNPCFLNNEITNLSKYISIDKPVTFKYKGFKHQMTPYNLLKNKTIVFRSCLEKERYLQQFLKKGRILKVSGSHSYVQSKHGICKISNSNIRKGIGPNLKNAISNHNYFLNKLESVNINYKKRKIKIIGTYKDYNSHILVKDKYGECSITVGHLLQGKKPSIESALNKDLYFKNLMIDIYGDIYKYRKITKKSFRNYVEFKCHKHGWQKRPWKLFYVFKTSCLKCNKESMATRGFTKEKYVKICNGRKSFLYLLKFKKGDEEFYKIGLTLRSVKERFYGSSYTISEIFIKKDSAENIFDIEEKLHKKYKQFKYLPKIKFNGYTECYNTNLPIKEIVKNYA